MSKGFSRRTLLGAGLLAPALGAARGHEESARLSALETDWDVIVIGSGMAGLCAAISAQEAGARHVLVLEKGPLAGGHTLYASGSIAVMSPKRQTPRGIVDSPEKWLDDARHAGGEAISEAHIRHFAERSESGADWLAEHGVVFADTVYQAYGDRHPRSITALGLAAGRRYVIVLHAAAKARGIAFAYDTRAVKLERAGEDGRAAVHVAATSEPDRTKRLRAGGVVIATGGFTADVPRRLLYDGRLTEDLPTTANPFGLYWDGATGDGLDLGSGIGAALRGMENIILLPYQGGRLLDYVGGDIYVNRDGVRIVDESASVYALAEAILAQPDRFIWVITDSRSRKGATLGIKLANGTVKRSDSVEAMAKGMQVPASVLKRTLAEYNEDAEKGVDRYFGKTVFTQTIETPPYYWGRESVGVHMTLGGLLTAPDARLLDQQGRAIPGFWAAGETTGGVFGRGRPGGMSLTGCIVMGRDAGRGAAERAKALGF